MSEPKRDAVRAVFTALFDAVDAAGPLTEDRWEHLMLVFNETGRLVFGWPQLQSSESDIFGALDDIAVQLEGAKGAIEQTSKEARIVMHELHQALDPLMPEEDREDPEVSTLTSLVDASQGSFPPENDKLSGGSEPLAKQSVQVEQPVAVPPRVEEPPSRDQSSTYEDQGSTYEAVAEPTRVQPVTPTVEDEGMFVAIRKLGLTASYADLDRALLRAPNTSRQRLKLLDGYGTLPDDIKTWLTDHKGKPGPRPPTHAYPARLHPADGPVETFEERRQRMAQERSELTWRERHPDDATA